MNDRIPPKNRINLPDHTAIQSGHGRPVSIKEGSDPKLKTRREGLVNRLLHAKSQRTERQSQPAKKAKKEIPQAVDENDLLHPIDQEMDTDIEELMNQLDLDFHKVFDELKAEKPELGAPTIEAKVGAFVDITKAQLRETMTIDPDLNEDLSEAFNKLLLMKSYEFTANDKLDAEEQKALVELIMQSRHVAKDAFMDLLANENGFNGAEFFEKASKLGLLDNYKTDEIREQIARDYLAERTQEFGLRAEAPPIDLDTSPDMSKPPESEIVTVDSAASFVFSLIHFYKTEAEEKNMLPLFRELAEENISEYQAEVNALNGFLAELEKGGNQTLISVIGKDKVDELDKSCEKIQDLADDIDHNLALIAAAHASSIPVTTDDVIKAIELFNYDVNDNYELEQNMTRLLKHDLPSIDRDILKKFYATSLRVKLDPKEKDFYQADLDKETILNKLEEVINDSFEAWTNNMDARLFYPMETVYALSPNRAAEIGFKLLEKAIIEPNSANWTSMNSIMAACSRDIPRVKELARKEIEEHHKSQILSALITQTLDELDIQLKDGDIVEADEETNESMQSTLMDRFGIKNPKEVIKHPNATVSHRTFGEILRDPSFSIDEIIEKSQGVSLVDKLEAIALQIDFDDETADSAHTDPLIAKLLDYTQARLEEDLYFLENLNHDGRFKAFIDYQAKVVNPNINGPHPDLVDKIMSEPGEDFLKPEK